MHLAGSCAQPECARGRLAALVLLVIVIPTGVLAQQRASVSFRVVPFGLRSATPLFKVDVVESRTHRGVALRALTLTNTPSGPQLSNLALALPEVTIGGAGIASRVGDQPLPQGFLTSPLSGPSVRRPMRGLSFSTRGATPWTLSIGQLDAGLHSGALSSGSPTVVALAVSLPKYQRLSFVPRLLVPVGSGDAGQTVMGTAVQAELSPHISVVSDVGMADTSRAGWAPLASSGVIGQWGGTEIATSVLRGAPSKGMEGPTTVGSVDRELARGRLQPLPGLVVSGFASRSRPASVAEAPDVRVGSVGVVYDRLPYGQLEATRQREFASSQEVDTTRVEWRPTGVGGFTVRYTEKRTTSADASPHDLASKLVELSLPSLMPRRPDNRWNLRAALTGNPSSTTAAITSKVSGRFEVFREVALGGETELDLAHSDGREPLRVLRLTTDVAVMQNTAVQLRCTYGAGRTFSFAQAFEARVSRTFTLSAR